MTIADTVKTDLLAGTWTSYGSAPKVYIQGIDGISRAPEKGIILKMNTTGDITQDYLGNILYEIEGCEIHGYERSGTNRNNMLSDTRNILEAKGYYVFKGQDLFEYINKYKFLLRVEKLT